jgi:anti-anti-sigma factor
VFPNHNLLLTTIFTIINIIAENKPQSQVTNMELQYSELDSGIRLIKLIGNLDSAGFNNIDLKFTAHCAGENVRVLVDLSGVSFLASIGIRMLTMNAKSLSSRGGKMVLLNPTEEARQVLEMTGIPAIIPMYDNFESAETIVLT